MSSGGMLHLRLVLTADTVYEHQQPTSDDAELMISDPGEVFTLHLDAEASDWADATADRVDAVATAFEEHAGRFVARMRQRSAELRRAEAAKLRRGAV